MKKTFIKSSVVALSLGLMLASCAKKKDSTSSSPTPDNTSQQSTTAGDQSNVSAESDQALNDAQVVISGSPNNARVDALAQLQPIYNAKVDSLDPVSGKFTITYNGNNAATGATRMRTGTITVERTNGKWSVPNSVLKLTFTNYKVTKLATGKSITLNGIHTVTNVSSSIYTYANLYANNNDTIKHKVRGDMTLTFDDGTTRHWWIARHRVTSCKSTVYTVAISGDTSMAGYGDPNHNIVEAWGTNRSGENFYGEITSPITYNTTCGSEPISGVYVHQGIAKTLTVTYGVNSDGTVNITPNCPYGFKLDFTNLSNASKELILAY